jgi:hypothetical protein
MSIRIQPSQIQNLQQIEAVIAGPDGANRLFTVSGQFNASVNAFSQGPFTQQTQTFTVLVGPVFTRQQFFRALCMASMALTTSHVQVAQGDFAWQIVGSDADWDDESGQVELRIEVVVGTSGNGNSVAISGLAFHVTILAAAA